MTDGPDANIFGGHRPGTLAGDYFGSTHLEHDPQCNDGNQIVVMARHRLQNDPHLTVQRIWCEYSNQHLYLRGHVPTFYHKQLAQAAVAGLDGVDQVVNEIEVLW